MPHRNMNCLWLKRVAILMGKHSSRFSISHSIIIIAYLPYLSLSTCPSHIAYCNRKSHNLITSPLSPCKIVELSILFGFISFRPHLFFLIRKHITFHTSRVTHQLMQSRNTHKKERIKPIVSSNFIPFIIYVSFWFLFSLLFLFFFLSLSPSILKSR